MSIPARTNSNGATTEAIEATLVQGDLSKLGPQERVQYYQRVCHSLGLNPLTQPFEYITLNGKLRLYAKRDAADQLRKINGISIEIVSREISEGILTVHIRAIDRNNRRDEDLGAVSLIYPERMKDRNGNWIDHPKAGQKFEGDDLANAELKAITKAKRRVTLSISGLGFLDETEVTTIPDAKPVPASPQDVVDDTGELISDEQIQTIAAALKVRELDEDEWLKRASAALKINMETLSDIPVASFQRCLDNVRKAGEPQ